VRVVGVYVVLCNLKKKEYESEDGSAWNHMVCCILLATKVRMEVDCSNRLLNPHKRKVQNGKGHLPVILGDRDAFDMRAGQKAR
jgi:hypothetical protein